MSNCGSRCPCCASRLDAYSGRDKELFKDASRGNIEAIERLGDIAYKGLVLEDVDGLFRVFRSLTCRFNISSCANSGGADAILSAEMLAALRCTSRIFRHPNFGKNETWRVFYHIITPSLLWNWARDILCLCLVAPKTHREIIGMIDIIFGTPLREGVTIWAGLDADVDEREEEVISVFAHIWLADSERGELSITFPKLLQRMDEACLFLDKTLDGSYDTASRLVLANFRVINRQIKQGRSLEGATILEQSAVADWIIDRYYPQGAFSLAQNGSVGVFMHCLEHLIARTEEDRQLRQPLSVPECIQAIAHVMDLMYQSMRCGPSTVVQAVDLGILPLVRSTSVFWISRAVLDPKRDKGYASSLSRLAGFVEETLTKIQEHVYHRRVFPHIYRARQTYLRDPPRTETGRELPFFSAWRELIRTIRLGVLVRKSSDRSRAKFCYNMASCQYRSVKDTPRIRLKECTQCRSVLYCSTACQKADWVRHSKFCRWAANDLCTNLELALCGVPITNYVRAYYAAAVCYLLRREGHALTRLYNKNREKLRGSPTNSWQPSHLVHIDIESRPMSLSVRPLATFDGGDDDPIEEIPDILHMMRHDEDDESIIACAEFVVGEHRMNIFALFWEHFDAETGRVEPPTITDRWPWITPSWKPRKK